MSVLQLHQRIEANQGWRYLEGADAPLDLGGDATGLDIMPPALMTKLAELALI